MKRTLVFFRISNLHKIILKRIYWIYLLLLNLACDVTIGHGRPTEWCESDDFRQWRYWWFQAGWPAAPSPWALTPQEAALRMGVYPPGALICSARNLHFDILQICIFILAKFLQMHFHIFFSGGFPLPPSSWPPAPPISADPGSAAFPFSRWTKQFNPMTRYRAFA